MKRYFYLSSVSLIFFFLLSCNNKSGFVRGDAPTAPPAAPQTTSPENTGIFFSNNFNVHDSGQYELLMFSCRRCGTDRIYNLPGGGQIHQTLGSRSTKNRRFDANGNFLGLDYSYNLFGKNNKEKKCRNWLGNGFIEIKFHTDQLPTEASVTIQPRSSSNSNWGESFTVKGTAQAINKNKGFNIRLFPNAGLGGSFSLIIRSNGSNHVKNDTLNLDITYGANSSEREIISASIQRYTSSRVKSNRYTCDQYTN